MVDEKRLLDVVTNIVLDCQELPGDDQLIALQLAWWATACNIHNARVDTPRWFPAARERQAAMQRLMDAAPPTTPSLAELRKRISLRRKAEAS